MKAFIKPILYVGAGLIIGSASTYFIVRGIFQRQCDDEIDEAWASAEDYYHELYLKKLAAKEKAEKNRKMKKEQDPEPEPVKEKPKEEAKEPKEQAFDITSFRKEARQKLKSYRRNVFSDPPRGRDIHLATDGEVDDFEDDDDDEFEDYPRDVMYDGPYVEEPYVISPDQFADENRYWDKLTIFVYSDGNVIDDQGVPVDDIDACVGKGVMERIEELADDSGAVLVRNEMRSTDYELLLMNEPYTPGTAPIRED